MDLVWTNFEYFRLALWQMLTICILISQVDQVFEVRRNRRHWCGEIELPLPQRIIHTELLGLQDPDNSVDSDALFSYLREQVVPLLLNGDPIHSATGRRLYMTSIHSWSLDSLQLGDLICTPLTGQEANRYFA